MLTVSRDGLMKLERRFFIDTSFSRYGCAMWKMWRQCHQYPHPPLSEPKLGCTTNQPTSSKLYSTITTIVVSDNSIDTNCWLRMWHLGPWWQMCALGRALLKCFGPGIYYWRAQRWSYRCNILPALSVLLQLPSKALFDGKTTSLVKASISVCHSKNYW